jgi:hypothetical protein
MFVHKLSRLLIVRWVRYGSLIVFVHRAAQQHQKLLQKLNQLGRRWYEEIFPVLIGLVRSDTGQ